MFYYGLHHRQYRLGRQINRGGEGAIFELEGTDSQLAKLYFPEKRRDQELEQKLRIMVGFDSRVEGTLAFAFPADLLYDDKGEFAGFVMPRMPRSTDSIIAAVRPMERIVIQPRYDTRFSVVVALNLAKRLQYVEEQNCVIGDANLGNILVDPDGFVYIIDTDSWNVSRQGHCFSTTQGGVAQYMAPECLRSGSPYTRETDRYTLALWIFLLLYNGSHPFGGQNMERNIADQYSVCFATGQVSRESPPLNWPGSAMVSMFRTAFLGAPCQRPSAQQWVVALERLLHDLGSRQAVCRRNPSHRYLPGSPCCPWCDVEKRLGRPFCASPPPAAASGGKPSARHGPSATIKVSPAPKRLGVVHWAACYGTAIGGALLMSGAYQAAMRQAGVALSGTVALLLLLLCAVISAASVRHWKSAEYRYTSRTAWLLFLSSALVLLILVCAAFGLGLLLALLGVLWGSFLNFLGSSAGRNLLILVIVGIFLYALFSQ